MLSLCLRRARPETKPEGGATRHLAKNGDDAAPLLTLLATKDRDRPSLRERKRSLRHWAKGCPKGCHWEGERRANTEVGLKGDNLAA